MITKCRACQSKSLGYALKIKKWVFVFCKECTLLQREKDIPCSITLDFTEKMLEVDYYPAFLSKKELDCVSEDSCLFFSLTALEKLLCTAGYKVTDAEVQGNKLFVAFDKLTRLEKLHNIEKKLKLDNQFSFFLWALKTKHDK